MVPSLPFFFKLIGIAWQVACGYILILHVIAYAFILTTID